MVGFPTQLTQQPRPRRDSLLCVRVCARRVVTSQLEAQATRSCVNNQEASGGRFSPLLLSLVARLRVRVVRRTD